MKRYLMRIEEKVWVEADDEDEAWEFVRNEVYDKMPGIFDIDDVEICKVEEEEE